MYGAPDLSGRTRVSFEGNISMPLVGYVRIAGLTSSEAEGAIEGQLRTNNILNNPQVSLYVKEYTRGNISPSSGRSQGRGPILLSGRATSLMSCKLPVGSRRKPPTGRSYRTAAAKSRSRLSFQKPCGDGEEQCAMPGDTVVVPAAPIVYVLGEVAATRRLRTQLGERRDAVAARRRSRRSETHFASVGGTRYRTGPQTDCKSWKFPSRTYYVPKHRTCQCSLTT